ncbi:uncharacterized protein LOC121733072 [Aricia agestis]|uniref:uncharacterized protein LOC121733072 n=1 Tax=Aricia agestis TaxID=91739 RepID=UPI001C201B71|nr:uncharacterized protein LOC121733072 [Aricia agestis]
MDKSYVKSVLAKLKSYSSREIQDALLKIKTNIISNEQGIIIFRECGGLAYILPHIKKPNERTLDISLSILGNLCLDEQNSLDVAKSNVFGPLVTIINTVKRDSLLGRTSRLIGNLSQIESNAESFHNYGAVQALVTLINNRDKSTSYPTLIMAVRALRLLWMVEIRRHEMLSIHTVFCISQLLYAECQSMGLIKPESAERVQEVEQNPRKSQQELISGILKCMGYFSTCQMQTCVNQIGPRGVTCLVALMDTHDTALKCLLNLCYIESARPQLGAAGLVEGLVNLLEKESDVSQWPPDVVKALAQLCRGSTNRARLRLCGGLNVLLKAAKYNTHAFRALLQFSYDENSFQILVKLGLVNLVTDKLKSYVSSMDNEHNHKGSEIIEVENIKDDNGKEIEKRDELYVDSTTNVSKETEHNRKSLARSNSNIEDAIHYESQVRKRRKILKRAKSCNYDHNKNTSDSSSESDTEPIEPSTLTKNIKFDFMSGLASDGYSSGFSSEYGGSTASKRARFDWSPESGVSTGDCSTSPDRYAPWSPTSSGPTSPISINEVSEESDSELSGRYSPVCGEPDEEDVPAAEPEAPDTCNMEALVLYESDNEPVPSEEVTSDVKSDYNCNIGYIVNILFRVAFGRAEIIVRQYANTIKFLADEHCLNSMLDYISKTKRPIRKVTKTLLKVMGHSLCLMDILKHRLPLRLYRIICRPSNRECAQCKKVGIFSKKMLGALCTNAESRYGIGQISHKLLKGTEDEKTTLTTVFPFVIETTKILKIFLLDCDALTLLINMISNPSEDLENCIIGLSLIALNVDIKNPKLLEQKYKDHVIVNDDPLINNLPESDIVTFLLDDLSTVKTSKSFLCENSEVFSAMLMGQFKESSEKTVQLKNVSQSALKYLITLLQFGLHESTGDIEIFPITKKLATSLEVLLLVDRFLFDKLKDLLRSAIVQFQLTPETADKIYIWSLEEGMGFLCVEAVAYILTGKMKDNERLRLFNNILQLEYKNQWLEDIKGMILRQLKN